MRAEPGPLERTWELILGSSARKANLPIVLLSGGVGGARMARGLAGVLEPSFLTVVVNVGDDDELYGLHVSPDVDTVTYTVAGIEGPHGWGRAGDTFTVMESLGDLGIDTTFRLGDRDLALCLERTNRLRAGETLGDVTRAITRRLGIDLTILPATDDELRTEILTAAGDWISFQEYFVIRGHRDRVAELRYRGAEKANAAAGVLAAIESAAAVVIAPSNPPLSVWPILAVQEIREAVAAHDVVIAISPLFGGKALKGPAAEVMESLGLAPGTAGVLEAYEGIVSHLIIDSGDADDVARFASAGASIVAADTRIDDVASGGRLGTEILRLVHQAGAGTRVS